MAIAARHILSDRAGVLEALENSGINSPDVTATLAHVACKPHSAIDVRTTRHPGYAISQRKRKRIEEIFGWFKTIAGLRKTRHRGLARVGWMFTFALAAYNLVRDHPSYCLVGCQFTRLPNLR